jgi:hypothetical protein
MRRSWENPVLHMEGVAAGRSLVRSRRTLVDRGEVKSHHGRTMARDGVVGLPLPEPLHLEGYPLLLLPRLRRGLLHLRHDPRSFDILANA